MSSTTNDAYIKFKKTVKIHYRTKGRHHLPWRETTDPFKVLVSEVMLQQTQVDRVLPKYETFIEKWPTVEQLATASLSEVLKMWQGLGYNRRAKMLSECAQSVVARHNGEFPTTRSDLEALPGIGPYTAGAVMAFAYNKPIVMIETNIRTVFLHHFFREQTDVCDRELIRYIELTLDIKKPREWYWALMDYGSYLKKTHGNQNYRSRTYVKQSKFEGSDRQIRGAILRFLTTTHATRNTMHKQLSFFEDTRIDTQLAKLLQEGMVVKNRQHFALPD